MSMITRLSRMMRAPWSRGACLMVSAHESATFMIPYNQLKTHNYVTHEHILFLFPFKYVHLYLYSALFQ